MTRSNTLSRRVAGVARLLVLTCAFALFPVGLASAQILQTFDDSLTTYLPSSATAVQDVRPQVVQRGTGIDGSLRASPGLAMAIAGNPFENVWVGKERQGDLQIDVGAYSPFDVDLALPAPGFRWVVGRTYNPVQKTSGGSHRDSDGYQGANWFQVSQPEIVLYEAANDEDDVLYLVYGADRFVEFRRYDETSDEFYGINGAAGAFQFTAGATNEPDLYTYTDQHGNEIVFFGFDGDAGSAAGQLWKMTEPSGEAAYVGHETVGSTAISSGYTSGRITTAYDTADRRYTYTYTTLDSVDRLTQVKAEENTGSWVEVARVDYTYYSDESNGDIGDLETVAVTMPLDDSGVSQTKTKYYRYWEGTFDSGSNPGHPHAVQYVLDFEGARNFDWSEAGAGEPELDQGYLTASDGDIDDYSSLYFEYDSSHRVIEAMFNGECGCSGGASGVYAYSYETSGYTNDPEYDNEWARRTIVARPDGGYLSQHFDELGQGLHQVLTSSDPSGSPTNTWVTGISRGATGFVTKIHMPDNCSYTHSSGTQILDNGGGLVWEFTRESSGDMTGFVKEKRHQKGTGGTLYVDRTYTWTSFDRTVGDVEVVRPLIASDRVYSQEVESGTYTGSYLTSYSYTDYVDGTPDSLLAIEVISTTRPAVSGGNNGPGSSDPSKQHFTEAGEQDFAVDEADVVLYTERTNGLVTKRIEDADTDNGTDFPSGAPTGFESTDEEGVVLLHQKTTMTYMAQGFQGITTPPAGDKAIKKTYRTRLADQRLVVLEYPHYVDDTTDTFYGPVRYTVYNHAGKAEMRAMIGLSSGSTTTAITSHVDETDSDPILALGIGSIVEMTTYVYSEPGTELDEERTYFSIPSSLPGTDGTHYDPVVYGYDSMGRRNRVKEASGTIRQTDYDLRSHVTARWIGTNDALEGGTDDMVKTEALVYDSGATDENGYLTSRTLYVEDGTTGQRVTTYSNDLRGRVLLETNPTAPHAFHKVDNMGRRLATGLFSSTGSISVGSDDPTTEATNRLALIQTFYDERGQVWKTQRHEIDASDGSDDANLQTLHWYDVLGRQVKTDGQQLTKTAYDRIGRVTHEFVLAADDDSTYAHVLNAAGDIVLEERQTTYDPADGTVVMTATISRFHDDYGGSETTGALDTNADTDALMYTAGNLEGRIQITAYWYDDLLRQVDRVEFGTYGGSSFDRDGMSAPTRSDTALRWTTTYGTNGRVETVEDPRSKVTYSEYDAAGRRTRESRNYDSGVNSGNPSGTDDNVTTRWAYTDGLMVSLTADLPSGQTDQVTTYTYGTTKGGSAGDSKIGTGHLLQKVTYPDSTSGTDVVTHAYNAQSERIWTKDQSGNVLETDLDTSGRQTARKATTVDADFDDAVRRIQTTYDGLGRRQLVTQYDATTSGTVLDEVKYTYDGWGNVTKFEQDVNSAVGAGGSVDDYEVSYAWTTATTGRNTLRRTSMTLPSGNVIAYNYRSTSGLHDDDVSRVTDLTDGAVKVAAWAYNGLAQVVGTDYPEPEVMARRYGSTSGTYPDLDRFNRVVTDRWTKDLATDVDLYEVDLAWDRASNITSGDEQIHAGFDVKYTIDDVDRLTRAHEGTLSGGSITSPTRDQQWGLDQVGNWDTNQHDRDGDGSYTDPDELDEVRTHNDVNELTARDIDNDSSDDYTLVYDEVGNLIDDGESYKYEWDPFGRLRFVYDQSDAMVAEYRYNGLGYRIAVHEDTDDDGDVDGSDLWYYDAFDERWRDVARFRSSDGSPKEEFLYHAAGLDGLGGSSYIDLVVLRDRDNNTAWTSASDGVLEARAYYCQNWRADVSAIVGSRGKMQHWVKYSAYGIPFGLPGADTDSDGDCDSTDVTQVQTWIDAPAYNVLGDIDLDGDVDATDKSTIQGSFEGDTGGWGVLSPSGVGHRRAGLGATTGLAGEQLLLRASPWLAEQGRASRRSRVQFRSGNQYSAFIFRRPVHTPTHGIRSAWGGEHGELGLEVSTSNLAFDIPITFCVGCSAHVSNPVENVPNTQECWLDIVIDTTKSSGICAPYHVYGCREIRRCSFSHQVTTRSNCTVTRLVRSGNNPWDPDQGDPVKPTTEASDVLAYRSRCGPSSSVVSSWTACVFTPSGEEVCGFTYKVTWCTQCQPLTIYHLPD